MIKYLLKLNNGSELLGTTGKSITADEQVETCDTAELAREIAHLAPLSDERTNKYVLDNAMAAIVQKMAEGKAVILPLDGKAAARFHANITLANGSINEAKAAALGYPDITLDNIADIVKKHGGVKLGVLIEVEKPLIDALRAEKPALELADKRNIPYVQRRENQGGSSQGGNGGGSDPDDGTLG